MGSDKRMWIAQLWLLALPALYSVASRAHASPLKVMSAPNVLRVGTPENIFVECQDCTDESDIMVDIILLNYPTKSRRLASTSVNLTTSNKFQGFGKIMIPDVDFNKDPTMKQHVFLQAKFPDAELEKLVLVSFQSGYMYIQTDKTLYTPNSKVHFRIFAVTPAMEPVERNNETDASITIEIVTPEGIITFFEEKYLKSGIHTGDFPLGDIVSIGLWKVVTRFNNKPQQSYSAEFEVKEYVLPSFEVKLTLKSPFFYVDSQELSVHIKATYLFGQDVDGTAYGIFGVKHEGQKKSFPRSLQRILIIRGEGLVKLKTEHITQTFPNILGLVGSSIFVAVGVMTENGSEMVEAELRGIQIVTSPYTIHFRRTPKYFKPGMSFDVVIEVVHSDGTPAHGVRVLVNPGEVQGQTSDNGMARLSINTERNPAPMTITAKTEDTAILSERQATANMTLLPYSTSSNSYIHIALDTSEVSIGENLKISLNLNRPESTPIDITYLILSRGQLVRFGRYRTKGQTLIAVREPVTKKMLPSFRIVAYYHTSDNEVVSDSVWVDAKDSCIGSLRLEPTRLTSSYEPRKMFGLRVTGDPGATVGLVAVDKAVYILNNKHRLSQKKVWDMVERYDTGCTPGGGKDGMGVFYDAGLLFESDTASGTPYRQELKCPAPGRRKRAASLMDVTTSLLSQYQDNLQRDCCLDGMRDTPISYTCEVRSEYITDGPACVEAFLHCCREIATEKADRKEDSLHLARSERDEASYMDYNEIPSRTTFPESWLWYDIKLPPCPKHNPNCDSTSLVRNVPLQDSITTWQMSGISLSRTHGICVAEPLEVIVRKDFFIDLRLPYSAVRGEQLEIKAVLYNYYPDRAIVDLSLVEKAHVCSAASRRGKYRKEVTVEAQSTRSVPFIIIPTKEGEYQIEVKAALRDSAISDGIRKTLRVVPEGVLVKSTQIVTLDPSKKGVDGTQVEVINSQIPEKDFIPDTSKNTYVSVTAIERDELKNEISGKSMSALIQEPSGSGEENMIHMMRPVIATTYLDKTNQWEPLDIKRRKEALRHITTGYQNQLAYRKDDGSFAVDPDQQSSTWLTAYVAKVFAMAYDLVVVESGDICGAIKFLIMKAQRPDGVFKEVGQVYYREMTGDVLGSDSDASMTAFCLIAMQESRSLCNATVSTLPASIHRAVAYLEKRLPSLTNPYAVAMTSYALASENKLNREILNRFASPDLSYWQAPRGRASTLEATAYALLALVKDKAFEEARPVVRWFNRQLRVSGGFGSTQATLMVYQAVAEYWANAEEEEYELRVNLMMAGRSRPDRFTLRKKNFATRTSKNNYINKDVTVTAMGRGEALVKMVSLYYALPKEKESDCQKFNISVQLIPEIMDEDEKTYKLKIEVLYKDRERDATMSVLEIGLLTGFKVNTNDLSLLSKGRARTISKYEMKSSESQRDSLVIYLDKVSHTRPEEITFRIHQKIKVGVLQPASISVYEYYDHQHGQRESQSSSYETQCMKFYHPERRAGQLLRLCRNNECTCAEENCSMQKKGNISNEVRTEKVCETEENSQIDFVYKVRLVEFADGLSTDIYTMAVVEVIKEGSNDVDPKGKLRIFLSYQHCRAALNLRKGKTYLIMGVAKDISRDDKSQSFQYVLGERTWIEYWPTEAQCTMKEYQTVCEGMEEMIQQYTRYGCQM